MITNPSQQQMFALLPGAAPKRKGSTSFDDSFDEDDLEMHSFHEFQHKILNADSSQCVLNSTQAKANEQIYDDKTAIHPPLSTAVNLDQNVLQWQLDPSMNQTVKSNLELQPDQYFLESLVPKRQLTGVTNGSQITKHTCNSPPFFTNSATSGGSPNFSVLNNQMESNTSYFNSLQVHTDGTLNTQMSPQNMEQQIFLKSANIMGSQSANFENEACMLKIPFQQIDVFNQNMSLPALQNDAITNILLSQEFNQQSTELRQQQQIAFESQGSKVNDAAQSSLVQTYQQNCLKFLANQKMQQVLVQTMEQLQNNNQATQNLTTVEEFKVRQEQSQIEFMQKLSQLRSEAFCILSSLLQVKGQIGQIQQVTAQIRQSCQQNVDKSLSNYDQNRSGSLQLGQSRLSNDNESQNKVELDTIDQCNSQTEQPDSTDFKQKPSVTVENNHGEMASTESQKLIKKVKVEQVEKIGSTMDNGEQQIKKQQSQLGKRGKRVQHERRCEHKEMPHYSDGLCKKCYLSRYYQLRKKKNQMKKLEQQNKAFSQIQKGNSYQSEDSEENQIKTTQKSQEQTDKSSQQMQYDSTKQIVISNIGWSTNQEGDEEQLKRQRQFGQDSLSQNDSYINSVKASTRHSDKCSQSKSHLN